MSGCEVKVDLYQMAVDAGMSDEEFRIEIRRLYASDISVTLEENPGQMIVYTVNYNDHDVEIIGRRVSEQSAPMNTSIN